MTAKEKYDSEHPILSFRVTSEVLKKVNKIVRGRSKYQSKFNRQAYLLELLQNDLEKLGEL